MPQRTGTARRVRRVCAVCWPARARVCLLTATGLCVVTGLNIRCVRVCGGWRAPRRFGRRGRCCGGWRCLRGRRARGWAAAATSRKHASTRMRRRVE
eukprot:4550198-Prymnesium_polylepis.1